FFFQAEDGIRDFHVTGVQTCALPIWAAPCLRRTCKLGLPTNGRRATCDCCDLPRRRRDIVRSAACSGNGTAGGRSGPAVPRRTEIGRASCRERGWARGGGGSSTRKKR